MFRRIIVNQANNGVIGIHQGEIINSDLNTGRFIREINYYIKANKEIFSNKQVVFKNKESQHAFINQNI